MGGVQARAPWVQRCREWMGGDRLLEAVPRAAVGDHLGMMEPVLLRVEHEPGELWFVARLQLHTFP